VRRSIISVPSIFTDGDARPSWPVIACLAALIFTFAFRCCRTHRVFNDTADEAVHIACGLEVIEKHQYTLEPQHPPLGRVLLAVPAHLAGLRSKPHAPLWRGESSEFYWRTLSMARVGTLFWAPFLILYIYRWARQLYGRAAGIGAAALAAFSPNLMAHASLATLDFGAAASIFISLYYFWRWSQRPGAGPCLAAALAFAIAVLVKFSALALIPPVALAFFLIGRWSKIASILGESRSGRLWKSLQAGLGRWALFLITTALIVWGGYGFDVGPLGRPAFRPAMGAMAHALEHKAEIVAGRRALPAPRFWRGILDVAGHNAEGHPCYLLGRVSLFGWWYYFPVALAVKTTIPLLLMVSLSTAACLAAFRSGGYRRAVYPLAAAIIILVICMKSSLNLGIRHILPIYPFFALLAAGLFADRSFRRPRLGKALAGIGIALAGWHSAESLLASPDYLAYFNQAARGREEKFLLDSNLDWGQDLERLRRFLAEKRISTIYLSYFGAADPASRGIVGARALPAGLRPSGWVAVSKNHIAGLALEHDYRWLTAYTPAARIGKSILVYYFPSPP